MNGAAGRTRRGEWKRPMENRLAHIIGLAREDDNIRSVVLYGSRADDRIPPDPYQDLDLFFIVRRREAFDRSVFGDIRFCFSPSRVYPDLFPDEDAYLMILGDDDRIDLTVGTREAYEAWLPGSPGGPRRGPVRILLDKNGALGVSAAAVAPRDAGPSMDEARLRDTCTEFFWETQNMAKGLLRDEIPYAMFIRDVSMRDMLHRMLDARIGQTCGDGAQVGTLGRHRKKYLPEARYSAYRDTYRSNTDADLWDSLYGMMDLFRDSGTEVAEACGFEYPAEDERTMRDYVRRMRGRAAYTPAETAGNGTDDLSEEAFRIDAARWCREIESFIRHKFDESMREGIVVGISGGLDSSVTAALCVRAVGRDKVVGLLLPERFGNPEAGRYGRMIAAHLGIPTARINITPILRGLGTSDLFLASISGRESWKKTVNRSVQKKGHTAEADYLKTLQGTLDPERRRLVAKVGSKQRARLAAVYRFAEENNCLVAGSSHKTERMVGLFVKYGIDDGADIMPLRNLYRSHTMQLAEHLGIPAGILRRPPNPDILPGITDKYQGYFHLDPSQVDRILLGLEKGLTDAVIAERTGIEETAVRRIREVVRLSENIRSHEAAPDPT